MSTTTQNRTLGVVKAEQIKSTIVRFVTPMSITKCIP
jgi:hypothetical protein